jgi:hypothetical protein
MIKPNKEGADWLVIKAELKNRIASLQEEMLNELSVEQYNSCRGAILMARQIIEWVEPTTPPQITEDTYGFIAEDDRIYT